MAEIVPTITVATAGEYHDRLQKITPHTKRIHVDISDGIFAPNQLIGLGQVYAPEGIKLDLHLMVKDPLSYLESALALKPNLIIIHNESEGDHAKCINEIQSFGVDAGVAYLADSQPNDLLLTADHALIFTGSLGHYGGVLDEAQLIKIDKARMINPNIEVSVDGGVNITNAKDIAADILYVGAGYLEMVGE